MSAANSKKVYALIDSETKAGLYVSNDLGENWEFVSNYFQIIGRPFYYSHIYASPLDANELWCPNNRMFMSENGGITWGLEPGIKDDFHDVWIDNKDPNRMIATNDGRCQVSMTGGKTWSGQYTQKISQLYRVNVDNDFPYNVYGSVQDLLAYKIPSASRWGGISGYETTLIGNGEISSVIPNPEDPNIVYNISGGAPFGSGAPFTVNNIATGQNEVRSVWPVPLFGLNGHDLKYRFNWDTPFLVSPHDAKTIYLGGNVVFKTTDEGLNWEVISEDLTNDIEVRQKITGTDWLSEYFGQEIHSTIKRLTESPVKQGLLWSGSDDGKIFITQNGGDSWEDVSILDKALPEFSQVYEIEPSPFDAATAYVVFSNFNTYDDYNPYIYKTTDYGKTWTNLSANFPQSEITRTIREDKIRKGMLYVGTETGVYYSINDGQSWNKLKANLPAVPVVDMVLKNEDLVIATNGRGFWIMDDLTPLRAEKEEKEVTLYPIPNHTRFGYIWWMDYVPGGDPGDKKNYFVQNMRPGLTYYEEEFVPVNGERKRKFLDAGDPKPLGPVMYFRLAKEPTDISLAILDEDGKEIRNYSKAEMKLNFGTGDDFNAGLNKFVWNMRINRVTSVPKRPATAIAPFVAPGTYIAQLTVDGLVEVQEFEIFMNPKESYTQKQADTKFDFWMDLYNVAESSTQNVITALKVKEEVAAKLEAFKKSGANSGSIKKAEKQVAVINGIVDTYEATYVSTGRTLAEVINLPATILFKMSFMSGILDHSEGPVTNSMKTEFEVLKKEDKVATEKYNADVAKELARLENLIK